MIPVIDDIRPSPISGTWYSGNQTTLKNAIDQYFSEARLQDIKGEILGLIVPHAGHIYSGLTAAHAFKYLNGKHYSTVIIVSPYHAYHPLPILTSAHQAYRTPLGTVTVNNKIVSHIDSELRKRCGLNLTPVRNDSEHSLEIELPFLQVGLGQEFSLVPIMLRDQSEVVTNILGEVLADVTLGTEILLIASTDLSHFFPERIANGLDRSTLNAWQSFEVKKIHRLQKSGEGQACGFGAVASVLAATKANGANTVTVVDYRTSANVTYDKSSVVGYGAAVISKDT